MNIALTGASGFVGGHIARRLLALGHSVQPFGQRASAALSAPLPHYRAWNVADGPIHTDPVDVVVHAAALVGDWGDESHYHRVNVTGTEHVLATFPETRVIYISSSSVYSDRQEATRLRESAPTGECRYSAYGRTKAKAEHLVLARPGSLVLRPHIVYGPGDSTLLPRVMAARRWGTLIVPGDGTNTLSVTHIENLTAAVVGALDLHRVAGAYNIVDAEPTTLNDVMHTLLSRAGAPTRLLHVPRAVAWHTATMLERLWPGTEPPRGPRLTRYLVHQMTANKVLDITKAQCDLGYRPQWSLHTDASAMCFSKNDVA